MEVKMFIFKQADNAEPSINEWLKENKVKVQYISQSQCERNGGLLLIVSIFYTGI
jgi:hypothetical protein